MGTTVLMPYKAVADVFGHNFVEPGEAIKH